LIFRQLHLVKERIHNPQRRDPLHTPSCPALWHRLAYPLTAEEEEEEEEEKEEKAEEEEGEEKEEEILEKVCGGIRWYGGDHCRGRYESRIGKSTRLTSNGAHSFRGTTRLERSRDNRVRGRRRCRTAALHVPSTLARRNPQTRRGPNT
jgi:hypothetical protein